MKYRNSEIHVCVFRPNKIWLDYILAMLPISPKIAGKYSIICEPGKVHFLPESSC